jgi:hypothetical protein
MVTLFAMTTPLHAGRSSGMEGGKATYGGYCEKRGEGCYGARRPVNSADEARALLVEYYADQKGVVIGRIVEKRWGFEAEIRDRDDVVRDRVVVHRRSGWIRSMF